VTRVAIVGGTAELRAALARTLALNPEFEIAALAAALSDVSAPVDLVLVARAPGAANTRVRDRIVSAGLTNREREVLTLLADGLGNKQIAARLGISTNTVKTHLELLFEKLGVSTRAQAVAAGVRLGLLML
jgi:ATP/maltotriose-dependent transcriptional regulator MalT